jgi:hypothetical protein
MKLPKELTTVTPVSKFLAIVVFITLPFLGFVYGMKYQELLDFNQVQDVSYSARKVKRLPTPTPDPTAHWKTYENRDYNFQFKYPSDLYIKTDLDMPNKVLEVSNDPLFEKSETAYILTIYTGTEGLNIDEMNNKGIVESEGSINKLLNEAFDYNLLNSKHNGRLLGTFLGNPPWGNYEIYFPNGNNNLSGISFDIRIHQTDDPAMGGSFRYREMSKLILSTFKFTNLLSEQGANNNEFILDMSAQNNTGETGSAKFTKMGNSLTKITLTLDNVPGSQPAYIYSGSCNNPGPVKFTLNNVTNGLKTNLASGHSETILNVSLEDLRFMAPLAIGVRYADSFMTPFLSSCGNLN